MIMTVSSSERPEQGMSAILVVGAGSAIAQAIIRLHQQQTPKLFIVAVTRGLSTAYLRDNNNTSSLKIVYSDYSKISVQAICDTFKSEKLVFDRVYICNGVLHGSSITPEKRMADFELTAFLSLMETNAAIPMLWMSHFSNLLARNSAVTVFSARVGSIDDNKLGGWYSYRASKAALNMLMKTAALELTRKIQGVKVMLFHPGTTDTKLSKPFQKNVSTDKLFSPDFVANQLDGILTRLNDGDSVLFMDWEGKKIKW